MNKDLEIIRKHILIINKELGVLKNDMKWIKRSMYYMATLLVLILAGVIIGGII